MLNHKWLLYVLVLATTSCATPQKELHREVVTIDAIYGSIEFKGTVEVARTESDVIVDVELIKLRLIPEATFNKTDQANLKYIRIVGTRRLFDDKIIRVFHEMKNIDLTLNKENPEGELRGFRFTVPVEAYRMAGHVGLSVVAENRVMWPMRIELADVFTQAQKVQHKNDEVSLAATGAKRSANERAKGKKANKPLFRDPVYDGAADPVVIWNEKEQQWYMFYTNRRANLEGLEGVEWVHDTPISIAVSDDGGASWQYKGEANIAYGEEDYSYWAPDVIEHNGTYHMYLTVVPGTFKDWSGTRDIVHLTSNNLIDWEYQSTLDLASDRVIDAGIMQLPNGKWGMWYNDERDDKSIYFAESNDLYSWQDKGKATGDQSGEGPKVFRWKDKYWMIVDMWDGLGVYSSDNAVDWKRQEHNLLREPGTGADDQVKGGHADVVVSGKRAYLFYFTHPGRRGPDKDKDTYEQRRSSIQVVELEEKNGELLANRNQPTYIALKPSAK